MKLNSPTLVISDYALIKSALEQRPEGFQRSVRLTSIINEAGFRGVFTAEGDVWKRFRRLTSPALSKSNANAVDAHVKIAGTVAVLINKWAAYAKNGKGQSVIPLAASPVQDHMSGT